MRTMTTICGHALSVSEVATLNELQDYLRKYSGDSSWSSGTSPRGDGRLVPLNEIFPGRNNAHSARRRTVRRLAVLGILRACDIQYLESTSELQGVRTPPVSDNVTPAGRQTQNQSNDPEDVT